MALNTESLMRNELIGRSGIRASVIGLGTWVTGGWRWGGIDEREATAAIHAALDRGINLIDTAPIYGFGRSETIVGKALGHRRDRVVLMTKCGQIWNGQQGVHAFDSEGKSVYRYLGPESVRYELEQSLIRLNTDYIDVYLLHIPDPTTPPADTMGALVRLKEQGKIRALGLSNMSAAQLRAYHQAGPVDVDQEKYSLLDRAIETEQLPYCRENGISLIAYSPLVQGLLTGKIGPDRKFTGDDLRRDNPRFRPEILRKVHDLLDQLKPVANRHGLTLGQLALAWTIAQPGVSHVLVGARTPQQVWENAPAAEARLSPSDRTEIDAILQPFAAEIP